MSLGKKRISAPCSVFIVLLITNYDFLLCRKVMFKSDKLDIISDQKNKCISKKGNGLEIKHRIKSESSRFLFMESSEKKIFTSSRIIESVSLNDNFSSLRTMHECVILKAIQVLVSFIMSSSFCLIHIGLEFMKEIIGTFWPRKRHLSVPTYFDRSNPKNLRENNIPYGVNNSETQTNFVTLKANNEYFQDLHYDKVYSCTKKRQRHSNSKCYRTSDCNCCNVTCSPRLSSFTQKNIYSLPQLRRSIMQDVKLCTEPTNQYEELTRCVAATTIVMNKETKTKTTKFNYPTIVHNSYFQEIEIIKDVLVKEERTQESQSSCSLSHCESAVACSCKNVLKISRTLTNDLGKPFLKNKPGLDLHESGAAIHKPPVRLLCDPQETFISCQLLGKLISNGLLLNDFRLSVNVLTIQPSIKSTDFVRHSILTFSRQEINEIASTLRAISTAHSLAIPTLPLQQSRLVRYHINATLIPVDPPKILVNFNEYMNSESTLEQGLICRLQDFSSVLLPILGDIFFLNAETKSFRLQTNSTDCQNITVTFAKVAGKQCTIEISAKIGEETKLEPNSLQSKSILSSPQDIPVPRDVPVKPIMQAALERQTRTDTTANPIPVDLLAWGGSTLPKCAIGNTQIGSDTLTRLSKLTRCHTKKTSNDIHADPHPGRCQSKEKMLNLSPKPDSQFCQGFFKVRNCLPSLQSHSIASNQINLVISKYQTAESSAEHTTHLHNSTYLSGRFSKKQEAISTKTAPSARQQSKTDSSHHQDKLDNSRLVASQNQQTPPDSCRPQSEPILSARRVRLACKLLPTLRSTNLGKSTIMALLITAVILGSTPARASPANVSLDVDINEDESKYTSTLSC